MEQADNDFNLVVLTGRLAVAPDYRAYDSGARLIRYLIITRSSEPLRRVDNIPVVQWDPPDAVWEHDAHRHDRVSIIGTIQRRFRITESGRVANTEIVASRVLFRGVDDQAA